MEKNIMSRSYQENLLANLTEQSQEMLTDMDQVASAKKILVSMRYFMTNFVMDDDIIDDMSTLVDQIMRKLDISMTIPAQAQQTMGMKVND